MRETREFFSAPRLYDRWYAERRTGDLEALTHSEGHGVALSPNGRHVAVAMSGSPANKITIFDLNVQSEHTQIVHPDRRLGLLHPTFSPSGMIAFVVAAPSHANEFTGLSEIWVTDLAGSVHHVLASDGRFFAHPTFSPDGKRLSYFRDVEPRRLLAGNRRIPPENREAPAMALFETNLQTGVSRRVGAEAYLGAGHLAYLKDGESTRFLANLTLEGVEIEGATDYTITPRVTERQAGQVRRICKCIPAYVSNGKDDVREVQISLPAFLATASYVTPLSFTDELDGRLFVSNVEGRSIRHTVHEVVQGEASETGESLLGADDFYLASPVMANWTETIAALQNGSVRGTSNAENQLFIYNGDRSSRWIGVTAFSSKKIVRLIIPPQSNLLDRE